MFCPGSSGKKTFFAILLWRQAVTQVGQGSEEYVSCNHLGNVLVVASDRKIAVDTDNNGTFDFYTADVLTGQDYLPFGSLIKSRSFGNSGRYGFNGMEKDDEVSGNGNSYTAEFWQYDPRLGRRWNIDPVISPWESSYAAFRNSPVILDDPYGDCAGCPEGGEKDKTVEGGSTAETTVSAKRIKKTTPATVPPEPQEIQRDNTRTQQMAHANLSTNRNVPAPDHPAMGPMPFGAGNPSNLNGNSDPFLTSQGLETAQDIAGASGVALTATDISLKSSDVIQALRDGKFIADLNGKTYRWKMSFQGNQYISSEAVAAEKAAFNGVTKIKVFNAVKVGGRAIGFAGVLLTGYQIIDEGEVTLESGADLTFGVIGFFGPVGAVVSGGYFLGKAAHESSEELIRTKYNGDREAWKRDVVPYGIKCFIAGTQITMSDGSTKNIEDVVTGDVVKTYNLETGRLEDQPVLKIESPVHSDLVEIDFEGGIQNTNTFDHPYYVKGKGWSSYKPKETKVKYGLDAAQLKTGDICYYYEKGTLKEIKVLGITENIRSVRTYNLSDVAKNNNFFANGVLVHNKMIDLIFIGTDAEENQEQLNQVEDGH